MKTGKNVSLLETERGNEKVLLEELAAVEAVTKNPHFEKIELGQRGGQIHVFSFPRFCLGTHTLKW